LLIWQSESLPVQLDMPKAKLSNTVVKNIEAAVRLFEEERDKFARDAENLQRFLLTNSDLRPLVHSVKARTKDPSHLRNKLLRHANDALAKSKVFDITPGNVFDRVSDLAGVRLIHLHMRQMEEIHPLLMKALAGEYVVRSPMEAKTWDPEYAAMFRKLGLRVKVEDSFYTSVHYNIKLNKATARVCELQVRTLAEEIWGEISHRVNYPNETESLACKEQLKALARFVSGCSRLVDSIVASFDDFVVRKPPVKAAVRRRSPKAKR
jgi:ppGpp synthetase/RelA/SpoT-type nucleotidyltranferase